MKYEVFLKKHPVTRLPFGATAKVFNVANVQLYF
jgi:hypothetical protein